MKNTHPIACPLCGHIDCDKREAHAEALARIKAQDRAAFLHFTRNLPIKREADDAR